MQAIFRKAAGHLWRLAAIPRAFYHDDSMDCYFNPPAKFPTRRREAGKVIVSSINPAAVGPCIKRCQEVKQCRPTDRAMDSTDCDEEAECESTDCPEPRRIKVTLCGCNGRVGRYVALLLKQSRHISQLRLHDVTPVPTYLSDLSLIDTACEVLVFAGRHQLKESLSDADIVVMTAGLSRNLGLSKTDLFMKNAKIVAAIAEASSKMCPRALFVVVTNPINSLVPVVSEVLHHHHSYDANRVFGLAHTHVVRASTLAARAKQLDPQKLIVPVIGGNDPPTVIPVFTQAKPCCFDKNDQASVINLSHDVKKAGMDVVRAKNYRGSSNLCTAYATAMFVISLAKGLLGHDSVTEYAYVRSHAIHGCKYLVTPVELGEYGIKCNYGIPKLSDYEKEQLKESIWRLKIDIALGESFFKNEYLCHT
ncbi:malate dehydrogenase, mitochondrial [Anabrus simplex]|uniref:malate dehydrogenase, mitochondrial n=1 Tax=Anabrus simplex TaxID=316456 RepID=UPI0035A2CE36